MKSFFNMEGDSFKWFLERVCLHAYGVQLTQRFAYMQLKFAYPPGESWPSFCLRCGAPNWCFSYCKICDLPDEDALERIVVPEPAVPFFVRFGRTLLALRFPQRSLHLAVLVERKKQFEGRFKCHGCTTLVDAVPPRADKCAGCGDLIQCAAKWCPPLGHSGRCSMCHKQFCTSCITTCAACGGAGGCFDCRSRYECQLCVDPFAVYCVWHSRALRPTHHPFLEDVCMLCDQHFAQAASYKELQRACEHCSKLSFSWQFSLCKGQNCTRAVCAKKALTQTDVRCDKCEASATKRRKTDE